MAERIVIVTGATGGIGRAIVDELRSRGIRVIAAVRNVERARQLWPAPTSHSARSISSGCDGIDAVELDLASLDSVRRCANTLIASGLRIDGLINNAGIMPGQVIVTADGYELATQVNYVATKLLTDSLLPIINEGASIVFTTSVTRKLGRDRDDWAHHALQARGWARRFRVYGQSKRMIAAYAARLAHELEPKGIRVNCADPGIVDTNMITMGNRVVDALATALFRPFISTAPQGARAALRAFDSHDSGLIFSQKSQTRNNYGS